MVEVTKNRGENSQRVVHRFIRAVKRSGVLIETRKRRFHVRVENDTKKKQSALHRRTKTAEYEKLKKWGRL